MATKIIRRSGMKQVQKIISADKNEARRRVLNLYKAWYRQIPYILLTYHVPNISQKAAEEKLREKFANNRHVMDLRAIDLLVIKGQHELVETVNVWKQKNHILNWFRPSWNEKPTDFLSKFYAGQ